MKENRVVFLSGKIVNLRPAQKSDIPHFTRWINDPRVRQFLLTMLPQTEKQEESWYENLGKDDKNIILVIETKDGKPIGSMGIHGINWRNGIGTTGALIGETEYWGKGYGTDAKMILLDYAFNTLGLRKICSDVFAFNKRSLQYSLHCGYKIEGRLRKHIFRNGKFHDKIVLGVFRDEWLPIWNHYRKTGKVR
ncbi:MAG: diamine N-acetyltransferase [Parcubacteria bacterium C7867-006]|nr:MAG: diamine N-acetyltransferase [Parcubacteria bacterium C7867-006]